MNYKLIRLNLVLLLSSISPISYAVNCTFAPGNSVKNFSASVSTSIAVARNAAKGPIGSEMLITSGGPSTNLICTDRKGYYINTMYRFGTPVTAVTGMGVYTRVYATNVPGIGFRLRASNGASTIYSVRDTLSSVVSNASISTTNYSGTLKIYDVYIQFFVTGRVEPGTAKFNPLVMSALLGPNSSSSGTSETGAVTFSNLNITGSVPVTVLACETPDITVDLKAHSNTSFPDVNSTSPATSFNFMIKNCSKKLNAVSYTFKPASGISLRGSGTGQYLTLGAGSTASGVGVQMLYNDGSNVPFNTKVKYTSYSTSTGGNYSIPMKARYIRTGAITTGTANSAVEFEMMYE